MRRVPLRASSWRTAGSPADRLIAQEFTNKLFNRLQATYSVTRFVECPDRSITPSRIIDNWLLTMNGRQSVTTMWSKNTGPNPGGSQIITTRAPWLPSRQSVHRHESLNFTFGEAGETANLFLIIQLKALFALQRENRAAISTNSKGYRASMIRRSRGVNPESQKGQTNLAKPSIKRRCLRVVQKF